MSKNIALLIMPRSSRAWRGAEALWVTAAGWGAAAERVLGKAYIMTTDRIAEPKEVINYPLGEPSKSQSSVSGISRRLPLVLVTLLKDYMLWKNSVKSENYSYSLDFKNEDVRFIWEQHDLFPGPGRKMANELKVPLITYVHAPQVWESAKWGVKRPIWGRLIEKYIEARSLKKSDYVACVSREVADKLEEMGVAKEQIIVSPMAVDPYLFEETEKTKMLREELNLENHIVIGWTGSFRSFHGLDILLEAFEIVYKKNNRIKLLLVGDGLLRNELQERTKGKDLEKAVVFTGRVNFADIPSYVGLFDIAVVSAKGGESFHYSPLKLREYLAAGKATVAPYAGEIPNTFSDNEHLLLYQIENVSDLSDKLQSLIDNANLRDNIGEQGKAHILNNGTWDVELKKITNNIVDQSTPSSQGVTSHTINE